MIFFEKTTKLVLHPCSKVISSQPNSGQLNATAALETTEQNLVVLKLVKPKNTWSNLIELEYLVWA